MSAAAGGVLSSLWSPQAIARGVDSVGLDAHLSPDALFDQWIERARTEAARDFLSPNALLPDVFSHLNYDAYRRLRPRDEAALWGDRGLRFAVLPLPRGHLFREEVRLLVHDQSGQHEIAGEPYVDFVDYAHADAQSRRALGISGWRLLKPNATRSGWREFAVFQGGAYFRAVAEQLSYGLSARALALFTASSRAEEFPHFSEFLLIEPEADAEAFTALAFLDSPSICGAYRFTIAPSAETTIDVSAALFPRTDLAEVGIGAISSMYARGENDQPSRLAEDTRPRVHDSDGLLIDTTDGERIWRPLSNPNTLQVSSFEAHGVQGFGLIQRERAPENYRDTEALYHARPSLWVQPRGDWGAGRVVLAEIPTDSEYHDNIAAFWRPAAPWRAQSRQDVAYTLTWNTAGPTALARAPITATRVRRHGDSVRFAIEFAGPIGNASYDLWSSAGQLADISLAPAADEARTTLSFVIRPNDQNLIELRAALKDERGAPSSETWLYRWIAP